MIQAMASNHLNVIQNVLRFELGHFLQQAAWHSLHDRHCACRRVIHKHSLAVFTDCDTVCPLKAVLGRDCAIHGHGCPSADPVATCVHCTAKNTCCFVIEDLDWDDSSFKEELKETENLQIPHNHYCGD